MRIKNFTAPDMPTALAQVRETLGADAVINYQDTPQWGDAVLAATDGRGADIVVEVGGPATLP